MAAVWLDSATYPSIRAAISPTLTVAELPDAILALPIYTGVAELAIQGLDPDWAAHNAVPASFTALQYAAIYWCASLAVVGMPAVKREVFGRNDYQYDADVISPTELLAILRARASAFVALVVDGSLDGDMPFFFGVAAGTRARDLTGDVRVTLPEGSTILGLP